MFTIELHDGDNHVFGRSGYRSQPAAEDTVPPV